MPGTADTADKEKRVTVDEWNTLIEIIQDIAGEQGSRIYSGVDWATKTISRLEELKRV